MKVLKAILDNKVGKTKKSIMIGLGVAIVIAAIAGAVIGVVDFVGIIVSAAILVVVVVAVYFLLKVTDDLPDAFAN